MEHHKFLLEIYFSVFFLPQEGLIPQVYENPSIIMIDHTITTVKMKSNKIITKQLSERDKDPLKPR